MSREEPLEGDGVDEGVAGSMNAPAAGPDGTTGPSPRVDAPDAAAQRSAEESSARGHSGDGHSGAERTAQDLARRSGLSRDENGRLDVLGAVGGWRGVVESILPGLVYLVCVIATGQLSVALTASLATAAVFTLVRLAQRQSVTQAVSGLVGVAICALFARVGGDALDYYVWGFVTNAVWLLGLGISALVGWPLLGVLFGYIRGEGTEWRASPARRRVYQRVNAVLVAMFAARLLVQLPLYFAGDVAALGITRLVMGAPLYAAVLWLAWLWSRPRPAPPAG